jgi:hypothetical protein
METGLRNTAVKVNQWYKPWICRQVEAHVPWDVESLFWYLQHSFAIVTSYEVSAGHF